MNISSSKKLKQQQLFILRYLFYFEPGIKVFEGYGFGNQRYNTKAFSERTFGKAWCWT